VGGGGSSRDHRQNRGLSKRGSQVAKRTKRNGIGQKGGYSLKGCERNGARGGPFTHANSSQTTNSTYSVWRAQKKGENCIGAYLLKCLQVDLGREKKKTINREPGYSQNKNGKKKGKKTPETPPPKERGKMAMTERTQSTKRDQGGASINQQHKQVITLGCAKKKGNKVRGGPLGYLKQTGRRAQGKALKTKAMQKQGSNIGKKIKLMKRQQSN